jgi:ligand-binding SRPBCC domain-containing protein
MKIYTLEKKQILPIDKKTCWNFFSNPANLQKITPPDMDFEILSGAEKKMFAGQIIVYRIKLFNVIKTGWVTEITHVEEGKYFVDEQRFGPYKFWHHKHIFNETDGGMEICDIVHYALPFGLLGRLARFLFVRRKLENIFNFRTLFLEKYFNLR